MQDSLSTIGTIVAVVIIGACALSWSISHDAEVARAAALYETCVAAEYSTTPAAYYNAHGEYPACNF
jgi:hypothetical protein